MWKKSTLFFFLKASLRCQIGGIFRCCTHLDTVSNVYHTHLTCVSYTRCVPYIMYVTYIKYVPYHTNKTCVSHNTFLLYNTCIPYTHSLWPWLSWSILYQIVKFDEELPGWRQSSIFDMHKTGGWYQENLKMHYYSFTVIFSVVQYLNCRKNDINQIKNFFDVQPANIPRFSFTNCSKCYFAISSWYANIKIMGIYLKFIPNFAKNE